MVVTDAVPPPNVSVVVGGSEHVGRGLHLLYRAADLEIRSSSPGRILRAVAAQLDGWLPPVPGFVRLGARVLVGPDGAVLVDRRLGATVLRAERRAANAGFRLADVPFADLDPASGDVVLRPPRVGVDPAALDRLDAAHPPTGDVGLDGRRLPVLEVLTAPGSGLRGELEGPAARLVAVAHLAGHAGAFDRARLVLLAGFVERGIVTGIEADDERALVGRLRLYGSGAGEIAPRVPEGG